MSSPPHHIVLRDRVVAWFTGLPWLTKVVLTGNVIVFVLTSLVGPGTHGLTCLSAQAVLQRLQVYRLITAPLVHGSIMHLLFNMLALVPIASGLERSQGTLHLAALLAVLILLGNAGYVLLASLVQIASTLLSLQLGQALAHQCAIGFSGIVFGLIVIDNLVSHATSRSIFGLFSVPARVYPWALMVLWQLLLPSVSFLGHLTGIMVGECWVKGWLKHVTPSLACLEALEGRPFLSRLVMQPNYCPCSAVGGSSLASALPTSFGAGLAPGRGEQQVAQAPTAAWTGSGRAIGIPATSGSRWFNARSADYSEVPSEVPDVQPALRQAAAGSSSGSLALLNPQDKGGPTTQAPSPHEARAAAAQAAIARAEAAAAAKQWQQDQEQQSQL